MERDVRKLLELLKLAGYEPNTKCENPVCQVMAKLEAAVQPKAHTNGTKAKR